MSNSIKGINLLPNEYVMARKINFIEKVVGSLCVLELVCFVGFVALPPKQELKRTALELEQKKAQANSEKYAEVNKALGELDQTKEDIKSWTKAYQDIKVKGFIGDELLDELVSRIPVGVYITQLKITDDAEQAGTKVIEIDGKCEATEIANSYFAYLETIFKGSEIESKASSGEGESEEGDDPSKRLGDFQAIITLKPEVVEQTANEFAADATTETANGGEEANS